MIQALEEQISPANPGRSRRALPGRETERALRDRGRDRQHSALHGGRTLLWYCTSIGAVARRMFPAFDAEGRPSETPQGHTPAKGQRGHPRSVLLLGIKAFKKAASMPAGEVHT